MNNTAPIALIVDDDAFFRTHMRSILTSEIDCAEVIEAASLDEAIGRLDKRHDISVALFDLSMPMMKKAAALRVIRKLYPSIRVAVVSVSDSRRDVLSALEAGAHGYMPKSLGIAQFSAALKTILDGKIYAPPFSPNQSNEEEPRVAASITEPPPSKLQEQRKSPRQTFGAPAWIRLDGGFAQRACRLVDISETGIRLEIEQGCGVPQIFSFSISSGDMGRRARLKWRNGFQLGAEFF